MSKQFEDGFPPKRSVEHITERFNNVAQVVPDAVPDIQAELMFAYACGAADILTKRIDLDDVCRVVEVAEKLLGEA